MFVVFVLALISTGLCHIHLLDLWLIKLKLNLDETEEMMRLTLVCVVKCP